MILVLTVLVQEGFELVVTAQTLRRSLQALKLEAERNWTEPIWIWIGDQHPD